ncbi:MAG: hypothetical protein K5640_07115 [Treponema sp.]|nr:hypothetical protein [Treponema sp.]
MVKIIMFLFHVLILPGILLIPCYFRKSYKDIVVPAFLGLFLAIISALFYHFFIFKPEYFEFNFLKIILGIFLKGYVLPLVFTAAAYMVFVKGELKEKINSLFPLWISFYSIIIPFSVIYGKTDFSFFEVFLRPVLAGCLLILLKGFVMIIAVSGCTEKKRIVLSGFLIFASLCLCSLVETLWFAGFIWIVWGLPFAFTIFSAVVSVLKIKSL